MTDPNPPPTAPLPAATIEDIAMSASNGEKPVAELGSEKSPGVSPGNGAPGTPVVETKPNDVVEVSQLYSTGRLVVVFIALCLCMLLAALDVTIVSTAMPTIATELEGAELYGWVAISYALTSTTVQPLYGKGSDIWGRKPALIFAVMIFLVGSAICGASISMLMLVIGRAVQGIGGGGIQSTIFIIISEIVAPRERGKYQGFIGAVWGLASILGPLLGGLFTQYTGWRWCFYINLPLGGVAITAVIFLLRVPKRDIPWRESVRKIDVLGSLTLMAATVLTLLGLEWGGREYPWNSAAVISCLVIGVCFFPIFVLVEIYIAKEPIIPMYLFKNRNFAASEAAAFFQGGVLFSLSYYLPVWFQVVRGNSATLSGIMTLPFMLGVVALSIGSGIIMTKTGIYVPIAQVGGALMAISLPLIAIWTTSSSQGQEIGTQIMAGIGVGALLQTLVMTVQVNAPLKDIGPATASVIFFRTLGGVLGIAVFSTTTFSVLSTQLAALGYEGDLNDLTGISNLPPELRDLIREAFAEALRMAYFALTAFGGLAFIATLFIRHVPLSRMMQTKRGNVEGGKMAENGLSPADGVIEDTGNGMAKPPIMAAE